MMNCIDQVVTDTYTAVHGDCVEALAGLPDHCIGYSIFSPPFSSLYTYSNSPRDMGNCRNDAEFFEHFQFLVKELLRVMKPGRNVSFHCMLMPSSKERDGYIGLRDFRGDLIRAFQAEGFIFASEVTIWKDPVTSMQRTKALGLLHKTVRGNAAMSRQGIADYLVTMRSPGESERVTHGEEYPVDLWQKIASPVWMDINPSDTLQYRSAREHDDERHIAPLQLEVIRRGIMLWTNPGDIVLTPFMGIGSEAYVALQMGRKAVGVELKKSYYEQACRNLANAAEHEQSGLFVQAEEAQA
jgi:DNA modification methylase